MKLGEVKGNGLDGNVYIQLFGSKGNTAKIQLRQAGDEKNRFETGQEYKFMVTTMDIGKVLVCKYLHITNSIIVVESITGLIRRK